MTTLFLLSPAEFEADARLLWPDPDPDPGRSDPIMLEGEMDFWEGDDVIDFTDPWFLMTARLADAVRDAGLTGLHVVTIPSLRYSDQGRIRASLGEFAVRALPEFRLVAPRRSVRVRTVAGQEDEFGEGDELQYEGWDGDDFNSSFWGPVLTARARAVLEVHDIPHSQFWPLAPH